MCMVLWVLYATYLSFLPLLLQWLVTLSTFFSSRLDVSFCYHCSRGRWKQVVSDLLDGIIIQHRKLRDSHSKGPKFDSRLEGRLTCMMF